MKVLLHACCGPCLIYPVESLRQEGSLIEAYFYNPNIAPQEEFLARKSACFDVSIRTGLKLHCPDYTPDDFHSDITDKSRPNRCLGCWRLRLLRTARFAKENSFDAFTTTLLVSPYQDIRAIEDIGRGVQEETGVTFLFRDFRGGFRQAHTQAKAQGIYCQKYCGCIYSLEERKNKPQK